MAIYKLDDIATINMCKRVLSSQTNKIEGVPFFKIGTLGKKENAYISYELFSHLKENYRYPEKGDSLISASGTVGKVVLFDGNDQYFQDSNIVWLSTKHVLKKYLFYWLSKNPFKSTKTSTIKRLYNSDILSTKINLPNVADQQKIIDIIEQDEQLFLSYSKCVRIDSVENVKKDMKSLIDIIEPIENQIELIESTISTINILAKKYSNHDYEVTDLKYDFKKGGLPGSIGKTAFLNVSAANGKINRFVENKPNVEIGDITISLDGNIGLVNNALSGFNGYLYKVSNNGLENYEIYYSLLHRYNQNITKINTTWTTIKHSPNSKKEIRHITFKNSPKLKNLFDLELSLKTHLNELKYIKSKTIKLLIA